ncbi:hypothetical protein GCM10009733_095510 [Nonomuraea maheshkhaliensis]|uniref:Uncharacterized protein n=1 Tax=Nonomuraea maheshkhaliensis TaxID=419590 RepID=A0ABN2H971_9ACTN
MYRARSGGADRAAADRHAPDDYAAGRDRNGRYPADRYATGRDTPERYPGDRYAAGGDAADEAARLEAPHFQACHPGTPMRYEPAYGIGAGGRPLTSERDRDAERIRAVLRRVDGPRPAEAEERYDRAAGECYDDTVTVTGGDDGVYVVTCADAYAAGPARMGARVSALARAGMTADPRPDGVLHVRVTPAR